MADLGTDLATAFVQSAAFQQALDAVEVRAREAVVKETKANAITLMALAVAGGAVGGFALKGSYGLAAAALIAFFAVKKLAGDSGDQFDQAQPGGTAGWTAQGRGGVSGWGG